jgi:hypothetical protein
MSACQLSAGVWCSVCAAPLQHARQGFLLTNCQHFICEVCEQRQVAAAAGPIEECLACAQPCETYFIDLVRVPDALLLAALAAPGICTMHVVLTKWLIAHSNE